MSVTLIQTVTLSASADSITFSSIPQTATDLFAIISARGNSTTTSPTYIELNGNTNGYSYISLQAAGTTVSSISGTAGFIGYTIPSNYSIGIFSSCEVYLTDYAAAKAKTWDSRNTQENDTATAPTCQIVAGAWTGTSAITSIRFHNGGTAQFVSGTSISLYSVTKGSGGATVS